MNNNLLIVVRSVVVGILVAFLGITFWTADFTYVPMPWSMLIMVLVLGVYIKYFSGSWWPRSSQEVRRLCFRSVSLTRAVWKWGIVAALLFVVFFESSFVVTFRLIPFPEAAFKTQYNMLNDLPIWIGWLAVIISSMVAGICEETGFRGYMQRPLEIKLGPAPALVISSFVFFVVHLSKAWAGDIIPHIFIGGFLLGLLAYSSGSLIPSIIAHTVMDICNFSYWWSNLAGNFDKKTIGVTGVDAHFIIWVLVFASSGILFVMSTNRLRRIRPASP